LVLTIRVALCAFLAAALPTSTFPPKSTPLFLSQRHDNAALQT
jgi:hypothetical protein